MPAPLHLDRLPVQSRVELGIWKRGQLMREVRKSKELIQRLKLEETLKLHTGCVNTLDWHTDGQHLLTGSDDLCLVIWDTKGKGRAEPFRFKTDHRSNIFSAKFLQDGATVSASGDGLVIFSQIGSVEVVQKKFTCHTGTTYRVSTLPDDTSSFLSCSEDGTVRLFDIRQEYAGCDKTSGCSHSLLVKMESAVSAIAVNPVRTHELAVGCSDSTIAFYDRRKIAAPLNRIRCRTTNNVPRRITSLQYDALGMQLLANVLCENIQLLDLRVDSQLAEGKAKKLQDPKELFPVDPMPIKRLRLRGDWSDTGPQSRPNQRPPEAASGSSRFMVEISDLMTTWMRNQIAPRDPAQPPRAPLVSTTDRSGDGGRNDSGIEDLLACAATKSKQPPDNLVSLKPVVEYSGHRSSRTMIKEACFWDDAFVISGSDCGRAFMWDRQTGKLVNAVDADKHVVNCVQPHPFEFTLATSGIDHDVKVWKPTAPESTFDPEVAQGYMDVNNQMLAETRDTVTVPAVCVVQILRAMARSSQEGEQRRRNNIDNSTEGNAVAQAVANESSDSEPEE
ncbi:DDB1- and CUL4-associated factor 6 [Hypsibius exemplaris]|uniref:DDB1- and CUL4-associated factor 6 n=1 Tax=Hypsibius exemplaris TaxID=2072580 RepID=A0A1W0WLA9_HYPEX|nr:DDB1- and CUL4-associated factor 6 [Hypsibius exemplaris]